MNKSGHHQVYFWCPGCLEIIQSERQFLTHVQNEHCHEQTRPVGRLALFLLVSGFDPSTPFPCVRLRSVLTLILQDLLPTEVLTEDLERLRTSLSIPRVELQIATVRISKKNNIPQLLLQRQLCNVLGHMLLAPIF